MTRCNRNAATSFGTDAVAGDFLPRPRHLRDAGHDIGKQCPGCTGEVLDSGVALAITSSKLPLPPIVLIFNWDISVSRLARASPDSNFGVIRIHSCGSWALVNETTAGTPGQRMALCHQDLEVEATSFYWDWPKHAVTR